jgi:hypothetical protein
MQATFSADGAYRHLLSVPGRHQCGWVMANPSKAGRIDTDTGRTASDPTASKVATFSRQFGYDGHVIANAYDKVSTDPRGLWVGAPPCSPGADAYLQAVATLPLVIIACGRIVKRDRLAHVERVLREAGADLFCLGVNDDGSPAHPLYLPFTTKLQRWPGVG